MKVRLLSFPPPGQLECLPFLSIAMLTSLNTHKTCSICNEQKSVSEFYKNKSQCKPCYLARKQDHYHNGGGKERESVRKREKLYGADYPAMYEEQEGACKICEKNFSSLCVDHDHNSGKVRGLLCDSCNLMLGYALDNITTLQNAITYLNESP